jgi:uncharacterized protein YigA (DUF484 family)
MNTKVITLANDFHGSSVNLRLNGQPDRLGRYWLSRAQVRRARRILCGHAECVCGGVLSQRGPQNALVEETYGHSLSDVRVTIKLMPEKEV